MPHCIMRPSPVERRLSLDVGIVWQKLTAPRNVHLPHIWTTSKKEGRVRVPVSHCFHIAGHLGRLNFAACLISQRATNAGTRPASLPTCVQDADVGLIPRLSVAEPHPGPASPQHVKGDRLQIYLVRGCPAMENDDDFVLLAIDN